MESAALKGGTITSLSQLITFLFNSPGTGRHQRGHLLSYQDTHRRAGQGAYCPGPVACSRDISINTGLIWLSHGLGRDYTGGLFADAFLTRLFRNHGSWSVQATALMHQHSVTMRTRHPIMPYRTGYPFPLFYWQVRKSEQRTKRRLYLHRRVSPPHLQDPGHVGAGGGGWWGFRGRNHPSN